MPAREVRLSPPPGFRLPSLADMGGVVAQPAEVLDLNAVYYDTQDLRLTHADASLHRRDDEWTVALGRTHGDDAGVEGHEEHRFTGAPDAPPPAALDLVAAFVRGAPVAEVARLKTRRRRIDLAGADRQPVARVVDDEITVIDGGRITARFRELEVTVSAGAPSTLGDDLVARLRAAGAAPAPPVPPLVRALGSGSEPGPLAASAAAAAVPAGAAVEAGHVVRAALARSVARLLAHDPGVRLGEDPEAVHQARVATRRLRSDLRTFRSLLDPAWGAALRDELRWLGATLGAVRDLEVMRDLLRREVARLAGAEQRIGEEFVDDASVLRHQARIDLLEALRSARYLRLLDHLVEAARAPALLPVAAGPAAQLLPPLLLGPVRHVRSAVAALPADPTDAALHEIRIRAKRLRYAAEAVAPVAGPAATELARRAAAVQDVLGRHQDAVVAAAWLRDACRRADTRPEAFTAGALAGLVRAEELATRAEWPAVWRRLEKKSLRAFR